MAAASSTSWTLIDGAAAGNAADRARFAERYAPVVRAYLEARWRSSPHLRELDDAVQEVFLACFQPGGVLAHADARRPGGFKAYLHGVVRNVARRVEAGQGRGRERPVPEDYLNEVIDDGPTLSRVFDRAWAAALVREAAERQAQRARGPEAQRRVELLRLRFSDGLPIREIARLWQADAARLHHDYATARQEFLSALREVVAEHHAGPPGTVDQACSELLGLLA